MWSINAWWGWILPFRNSFSFSFQISVNSEVILSFQPITSRLFLCCDYTNCHWHLSQRVLLPQRGSKLAVDAKPCIYSGCTWVGLRICYLGHIFPCSIHGPQVTDRLFAPLLTGKLSLKARILTDLKKLNILPSWRKAFGKFPLRGSPFHSWRKTSSINELHFWLITSEATQQLILLHRDFAGTILLQWLFSSVWFI